jgi:hypothetical protein
MCNCHPRDVGDERRASGSAMRSKYQVCKVAHNKAELENMPKPDHHRTITVFANLLPDQSTVAW